MSANYALLMLAVNMTGPQIAAIVVLGVIVLAGFVAFRFNTQLQMRVSFNMDDESKLYNKEGLEIYCTKNKNKLKKVSFVVVEITNLAMAYKNHPKKEEFIIKMADAVLKGMKPQETAARLSFNKFVALLDERDQLQLKEYCNNIEERVCAEGFDGYTDVKYELKFGVYESPELKDVQNDLRLAEAAIAYSTLCEGNIYYYNEEVDFYAAKELRINKARKLAAEQKQFVPYIVPRVSIKERKVIGGEITCRWVDAKQEELFEPQDFLPIFEADGFIKQIDALMFDAACLLAQSLRNKNVKDTVIAVNVSKQNFEDVNYADNLVAIAQSYNIDNKNIEIGLTGISSEDTAEMIAKYVSDLKQRGFRVSTNGFGKSPQPLSTILATGYDAYKLDRSFFAKGLTTDKLKSAVMDLINLIDRQEASVVCDGVSDMATMNYIASVNEDTYLQGSVISKAIPVYQFDSILTTKYEFNYTPLPKATYGGKGGVSKDVADAQNARIKELEEELAKEKNKKGKVEYVPTPVVTPAQPAQQDNSEAERLRKELEAEREKSRKAEKEARDAELKQLREEIEGLKKAAKEPIILEAVEEEKEEKKEEVPAPAPKKEKKPEPVKEVEEEDDDEDEDEDLEELDLDSDAEKDEEKLAKLMEGFKKQFRDQWEAELLKKYPDLMKKHNERKGFADRVIKMAPEKKEYYNSIKNALMALDGVKNVTKNYSDNFVYNRQVIAKIAVSGKSFKLYLALDPNKYPNGQFPHTDVSMKKSHAKTPFAMRTTSKLATKRARILIDDLAHINGIQKRSDYTPKDYAKGIQFQIKKK